MDGKQLDPTLTGKELSRELLRHQRLFEKRLQDVREEIEVVIEEGSKRFSSPGGSRATR